MKKIIIALTMALVLIPSFLFAANDFNASKYCISNGDFGVSHGACVSTVQACTTPSGTDLTITPLCICKFLRDAFPDDYRGIVGSNGLGECIQFIKGL
jgi:hypothetical protein